MQILFLKKRNLITGFVIILLILLGIGLAYSLSHPTYHYSRIQKTVVVDAGHGSIDSGAHYGNLLEKDINLKVAFILKKLLEESNIKVIMTRTGDSLYNKSRHDDIIYRARLTNEVKADAFISIHVNKFPTSEPFGGQAYYYGGEESKTLAQFVQKQLKEIQPDNYRTIGRGNYYVLKKARCPAIIVEIGFISNPVDRKRMTDPSEQERIATAIRDGLISYFHYDFEKGNNLIEETRTPENHQELDISAGLTLYFANASNTQETLIPVYSPYSESNLISVDKTLGLTFLEIIAVRAINQLIRGPESTKLISVIPRDTELKSLSVKNGLATLNFNQTFIENHWGGSESEKVTVASIVKTLTSIPGIDRVQILVEGKKDQTAGGHILFDEPFSWDSFD